MHTLIVVAVGFAVLLACALVGWTLGGGPGVARASLIFLPIWLLGAGVNLYLGVQRAGYSVAEEAPIFVLVFAIPAVAALATWWRLQ